MRPGVVCVKAFTDGELIWRIRKELHCQVQYFRGLRSSGDVVITMNMEFYDS